MTSVVASTRVSSVDLHTAIPTVIEQGCRNVTSDRLWVHGTDKPGVSMNGVGTVVRKNEFYSSYHAALLFSGNDHVIELK